MIVFYYSPNDGIFCPGIPQLEEKLIAISFAPTDDEVEMLNEQVWAIAGLIRDRNTRMGVLREDAEPPTANKLARCEPATNERIEATCMRAVRARYEKLLAVVQWETQGKETR